MWTWDITYCPSPVRARDHAVEIIQTVEAITLKFNTVVIGKVETLLAEVKPWQHVIVKRRLIGFVQADGDRNVWGQLVSKRTFVSVLSFVKKVRRNIFM